VEPSQFRKLISMKKPGDRVKLVYVRKAERKETVATLIEHVIGSAEHVPFNAWQTPPASLAGRRKPHTRRSNVWSNC
jgi:hypothetical protein